MDVRELLLSIMLGMIIVAVLATLLSGVSMSERHHLHHDTYAVSPVISRTILVVMLFMGVLGTLTSWLCRLGVFRDDPLVPTVFFVSFVFTLLAALFMVLRCRVMAYDDRMTVRPAFGPTSTVVYDEIKSMQWVRSILDPRLHDLLIRTNGGQSTRVWCLLDVEQMLLRIDRFDAFDK